MMKLILTDIQIVILLKDFVNYLSVDMKVSKIVQLGGFLGRLLCPLLKAGWPLMKNVLQPLAKSVLISLGLTAAPSGADADTHKKS